MRNTRTRIGINRRERTLSTICFDSEAGDGGWRKEKQREIGWGCVRKKEQ